MIVEQRLATNGLMSIGVGKPPEEIQTRETAESAPKAETKTQKALEFFGWDLSGTSVDDMKQFEDHSVAVAVEYFGGFGLTGKRAKVIYREDPSMFGRKYIEDIADRYFFELDDKHVEKAVLDVEERLSAQLGEALSSTAGVMGKLNENEIKQFICTNERKADTLRKLEYANLLQFFDLGAVIGSDSGGSGRLSKGEPQLRKVAEHFGEDYDNFRVRAGYIGDTTRDIEVMMPCGLRLLIGVADIATDVARMIRAGSSLPLDRFRVIKVDEYDHIVSYIELINRQEESTLFAAPKPAL
ncbi:MAG TPA: hypothetical protein VKC89_00280 [Patescibacteria group bacterium]|nr:hypothetical protein [Patescibacteria group bacterium]